MTPLGQRFMEDMRLRGPEPTTFGDKRAICSMIDITRKCPRQHWQIPNGSRESESLTENSVLPVGKSSRTRTLNRRTEQIIDRVGQLFGFADRLEARVAVARRHVAALTQSILAKAFRGELVPAEAELAEVENREYETASVLLDRIRANGEEPTHHKRPGRRQKAARSKP